MLADGEFVRQIAGAYEHLYDIVYLRTHPLAELLTRNAPLSRKERAWKLHHLLLDIIEELDPGAGAPVYSREWRRHRLMILRYVDGLDPQTVADRLAISRRTYYREHSDAVEAIAALLGERLISTSTEPGEAHDPDSKEDALSRLELLRLETARLARARRQVHLPEVVESAIELAQKLAGEKGISIDVELAKSAAHVTTDRNAMRAILLGILSYLVESLSSGAIHVRAWSENGRGILTVQSRGTRSAALPNDEEWVRLSMLEELGRMQGVHIAPLSDRSGLPGFRLQLSDRPRGTVLVVDDNDDVLQLFERYLAQHDYRVIVATTGSAAISLAKRLQPDAITLDLMMPDQDGWDVLQTLTNQPEIKHIPVIVCTVLSTKELSLSLGAASFLAKPVTEQSLIAALDALEIT